MKIIVKKLKKNYSDTTVLNIDFAEFESGKIYVLKGISGSGKSTFLNILGKVEDEYEGDVQWDTDVSLEKGIGYIFQESLLLSRLTIEENLKLIKKNDDAINTLLEKVHMLNKKKEYPEYLSGGERQRIAVARMLLKNPDIILADEPTAALDENNSENIASILAELKNENKLVIVATHEKYFDKYADEILYLSYGELVNA